jgi:hypothetical protein
MRWFFGAPFKELPPEFGDAVPSDLRVFEATTEEAQYHVVDRIPPRARIDDVQTKGVGQDESLERE